MNFVAKNQYKWYLVTVSLNTDGLFLVESFSFDKDGNLNEKGLREVFCKRKNAENRSKRAIKTKIKRRNYKEVDPNRLPAKAKCYFKPDLDLSVTPDQMKKMIEDAKREVYVYFNNVTGLENYFVDGIEYLGYYDTENEDIINVYDKFGSLRSCSKNRFSDIISTERQEEIQSRMSKYEHLNKIRDNKF